MKDPHVSVIVPFKNIEAHLAQCLQSIFAQSLSEIEIICVDDDSTDGSREIVERYAADNPRITLISHAVSRGSGGARNTGIQAATADYVICIDSDDYIAPEMLENMWNAATADDVDAVICGFNVIDELGEYQFKQSYPSTIVANTADDPINIFTLTNPAPWNKLWRRSIFIENKILFPELVYFTDLATNPRLLAECKNIRLMSDAYYYYRRRDNSITNTFSEKHILDYFIVFEILYNFLTESLLLKTHSKEFIKFIGANLSYHARLMNASSIREEEKSQYLRHLLTFKLGFLETHHLVGGFSRGELLRCIREDVRFDGAIHTD